MLTQTVKLSQLKNDTKLIIQPDVYADSIVMEKQEFLQSEYFTDPESKPYEVNLAERRTASFDTSDLREVFEDMEENIGLYEEWGLNVYESLEGEPETKAFLEKVKQALDNHPYYETGHPVLIDMTPDEKAGATQ